MHKLQITVDRLTQEMKDIVLTVVEDEHNFFIYVYPLNKQLNMRRSKGRWDHPPPPGICKGIKFI